MTTETAVAARYVRAVVKMLLGKKALGAGTAITAGGRVDLEPRNQLACSARESNHDLLHLAFDHADGGNFIRSATLVGTPAHAAFDLGLFHTLAQRLSACSIFAAIDTVAEYGWIASVIQHHRTAQLWTSCMCLFLDLFAIAPHSEELEPPAIPARFTLKHWLFDKRLALAYQEPLISCTLTIEWSA